MSLRFDLDQIKMRWRLLFLHSTLTHYLEIIMDDYSSRNHNSETTFFFIIYAKAVFHHAFTVVVLKTQAGTHSRESCNSAQLDK